MPSQLGDDDHLLSALANGLRIWIADRRRQHHREASAMIDFPSSPTVGQQFAAAGVIWTWDGTKWTAQGLSPTFLPLSGGTLSGSLGAPVIAIQNAAGNANPLWGDINGNARWLVMLGDGGAESGANAGSDFAIRAYSDLGVSLGPDLTINRATGIVRRSARD